MRISLVGGGNMGEAIIAALLKRKVLIPDNITASDINPQRLEYLKHQYGIFVTENNSMAIRTSDVVILAIKPQNMKEILDELKNSFTENQLVLSIVAGASIEKISLGLNHTKIVRAMPNTPARIGKGVTVWTASDGVSKLQKSRAKSILKVMGNELYVEDEKLLDMATAVSGSGPAYVFYFIEAFIDAAKKLGWPPEEAKKLVINTIYGAVSLLQKSGQRPDELRKAVTSPGGTTAAAIAQLEKDGFTEIIARAVEAAYQRSRELSK